MMKKLFTLTLFLISFAFLVTPVQAAWQTQEISNDGCKIINMENVEFAPSDVSLCYNEKYPVKYEQQFPEYRVFNAYCETYSGKEIGLMLDLPTQNRLMYTKRVYMNSCEGEKVVYNAPYSLQ
jgi:hypothetical protein